MNARRPLSSWFCSSTDCPVVPLPAKKSRTIESFSFAPMFNRCLISLVGLGLLKIFGPISSLNSRVPSRFRPCSLSTNRLRGVTPCNGSHVLVYTRHSDVLLSRSNTSSFRRSTTELRPHRQMVVGFDGSGCGGKIDVPSGHSIAKSIELLYVRLVLSRRSR